MLVITPGLDYARESANESPPIINVWYGPHQKVGHLGTAQNDFNLLGNVKDEENGVAVLTYSLNGAAPETLSIGRGRFGDNRRLAARGDFNADIPLRLLKAGSNTATLVAVDSTGLRSTKTIRINRHRNGDYPLPAHIDWSQVKDLQDVGQIVDGKWAQTEAGLRTVQTGYDRVFLVGNEGWKDYEVTVPVTIHNVDPETGPVSGSNGIGILMRFTGHATGTYRDWPEDAQPKWGYQPFGSIGWLRWVNGHDAPPMRQFYRGDSNETTNFGALSRVVEGQVYRMKMQAKTLPDDMETADSPEEGVTRYSWKIWSECESEPTGWDWQVTQRSQHALREGGVVLLAHHVDATFGDVDIEPLY